MHEIVNDSLFLLSSKKAVDFGSHEPVQVNRLF